MVTEQHRPKRRHLLAQTRLLMEWVADNYPRREWRHQFRVGADPEAVGVYPVDDEERRLIRNRNERVDMVIPPPPDLVVIEATMWNAAGSVSQLQNYLLQLPASPEYREWEGAPLVPILLTAQDHAGARLLCQQAGIRYIWWQPPWIDEYYALYPDRRRRPPHVGVVEAAAARLKGRQPTA